MQKATYEERISVWSSDLFSSDLEMIIMHVKECVFTSRFSCCLRKSSKSIASQSPWLFCNATKIHLSISNTTTSPHTHTTHKRNKPTTRKSAEKGKSE